VLRYDFARSLGQRDQDRQRALVQANGGESLAQYTLRPVELKGTESQHVVSHGNRRIIWRDHGHQNVSCC
jgi:hypothetical protein